MMVPSTHRVEVAVFLPIRRTFTYEVPEKIGTTVTPGRRVLVPFGRRRLEGIVLGPAQGIPEGKKILPIHQILEDEYSLPENLLSLLRWVAHYYLEPIGEVLKTALPAGTSMAARWRYRLTEKGEWTLQNQSGETEMPAILQFLRKRGGSSSASVLAKQGHSNHDIAEMIAAGLLEKVLINKRKIGIKLKDYIIFINNSGYNEIRLTSHQRDVLEWIRQAKEIPRSQFNLKYEYNKSILLKFKRLKLIDIVKREEYRPPCWEEMEGWSNGPPSILTDDQKRALEPIGKAIQDGKYRPFLLHGVTGSGKTEVYLRAIEQVVNRNRQALLLVPEISLTAQMIAYFRSRIQYPIAVLHSGLSLGERYDEWRKIKSNKVSLVIGARSAIFAPLSRLGMIIVDEEHDPSYKQEEKVRYNARDLALVRGKMENGVVILGSATPSLETFFNIQEGKIDLLTLPCRIEQRPLPEVQVVDMRLEAKAGKEPLLFSRELEMAMGKNIAQGEQAILFLNRRGFSTFALCRDCGFVYRCPNCSVSLIYHLSERAFRCHYCNNEIPAPDRCPQCSSIHLQLLGVGTQRLEDEIKKMFPGAKVGRMDRDTTSRKSAHQKILNQVRKGEINLLVGTQMIAKGHDLPRVTLVGVLAADLSLNFPDFRAGERTFQLLTQVAGRAGRSSWPGKVIIQTYNPSHYSIQMAKAQDFQSFYQIESQFREQMGYPPFRRLICLRLEGNSEAKTFQFAETIGAEAQALVKREKRFQEKVEILGPSPAPLARLKGKFRIQILLKGTRWDVLHDFAGMILAKAEERSVSGVKLTVDVDPVNML